MAKTALYGHFDKILVTEGQVLKDGDLIGVMGNTGYSFGAHLHLTVVPGEVKNPWTSNQAPGLGGTEKILREFVDKGRLFSNNLGRRPYLMTGGWLSYAGHYAYDMVAGGGGSWPNICWNQPGPGKVITTIDFGGNRTGKTVLVLFEDSSVSGSTGKTDLTKITLQEDVSYKGEYRNFELSSVTSNVENELLIQSGRTIIQPPIIGEITIDWERKLSPGTLKFDTIMEFEKYKIPMGTPVTFKKNKVPIFMGFIFEQKTNGEKISITVHDQIRYLKNKDSYVFKSMKASDILKKIASDFRLQTGTIESTEFVIPSRIEDNQTLTDIISNALDETILNSRKMFVVYDAFGKLTCRNIVNMKVPILLDDSAGEDFERSISINGKTFNKIKLFRDNKDKGVRELFIAQDSSKMNAWGVLQMYEKVDEKINAQAKADALLKFHNAEEKKLAFKKVFGDVRIRAGCLVLVKLGDVQNWMLVEKVKHVFGESVHTMDLTLQGGGYIA